jgi:hypothetical protein
MPAGDIWETTAVFSDAVSGKRFSVTLHGSQPGGTDPVINDTHGRWTNMWNTGITPGTVGWKTFFSANQQLEETTLRRVNPLTPTIYTSVSSLPVGGTSAALDTDPGSAILFSLRTGNAGRSYRGRMYMRSPTSDSVSGGLFSSADADEMRNNLVGTFAVLATMNFVPVVYSKVLGSAGVITQTFADLRIRSQRRRQAKGTDYV